MSVTTSPGARRALATLLTALAVAPAAAQAASPPGEYIDRASGAAGAVELGSTASPVWIADDGSSAYFSYSSGYAGGSGIYRRDLRTNTTTQLASAPGLGLVRATSDGKLLSIVTNGRFSPADTDNVNDLYLFDPATRTPRLVDVGPGQIIAGQVTADGTAALWTKDNATYRQPLAGGPAVKLGGGGFLAASRDGKTVVAVDYGTPEGGISRVYRLGGAAHAIPGSANGWAVVSDDGARVVVGAADQATPSIIVVDAISGASRTVALAAGTTVDGLLRFDPSGRSVLARVIIKNRTAPWRYGYALIDTTTGAASPIGPVSETRAPEVLSANAAFGIQFAGGHLIAAPLAGQPLPGGADLGSPLAYLTYSGGCRRNSRSPLTGRPTITLDTATNLAGAPTQVQVTFRKITTGAVIASYVMRKGGVISKDLTTGFGDFVIEAAATYPDGSVTRDRWTVKPYDPGLCPPIYL